MIGLNKRNGGVRFNQAISADQQFNIKRPAFLAGTTDNIYSDPQLPKNERNGLGNRTIIRNNFLAPKIKNRFLNDFEKLQSLSLAEAGRPITTGDNKLGYETIVKVPDPTDFKWLRAKVRLQAEITARFTNAGFPADEIPAMVNREMEINPPLGRQQRLINKKSSDISTETQLSTKTKLTEIIQEVQAGRAENIAGQRALTAQLVLILTDTNAISNLTQIQLRGLGEALARIGVPTSHKALGIIPRFVDIDFYNANSGIINLLFFSKVRETPNTNQYNYDLMVLNFAATPNGLPAMSLRSMVAALGRAVGPQRRYLDLERGGVISLVQLRAFARGNFDVDNFDIQPANR